MKLEKNEVELVVALLRQVRIENANVKVLAGLLQGKMEKWLEEDEEAPE